MDMERIAGFDWDPHNREKCSSHGVSPEEIESLFTRDVMILPTRSEKERRLKAIGRTDAGRHVFVVLTIRQKRDGKNYIRPISARYMHRQEVEHYEKDKDTPGL
jgi:uncharacterized protein